MTLSALLITNYKLSLAVSSYYLFNKAFQEL